VASVDGHHKQQILRRYVKISGLALDVQNGNIYWSESSYKPMIFKARLDGTNVTEFITKDVVYPTSLQVDLTSERLFWADMKKHAIESIRLDGTSRITVLDRMEKYGLSYPSSIDVFEEFVYGITQRGIKLFKVDKFGQKDPAVIKSSSDLKKTFQIRLFHQRRQMPTDADFYNPCLNAYCPQVCLVLDGKAKCVCNDKTAKCEPATCDETFCNNNGVCERTDKNENICNCTKGFTSHSRCTEKCHCKNKGQCIPNEYGYHDCKCADGFEGLYCEQCSSSYCMNNGTCMIDRKNDQIMCKCPPRWIGNICENATCIGVKCSSGQSCTITNGKAICSCADNNCANASTGTKIIKIAAPLGIVIALIIIVIVVILIKRARQRSQFAPKKINNIEMENPTYAYRGFQDDIDDVPESDRDFVQYKNYGKSQYVPAIDESEEAMLVINEHDEY